MDPIFTLLIIVVAVLGFILFVGRKRPASLHCRLERVIDSVRLG